MWNEGLGHLLAFPCSIDTVSTCPRPDLIRVSWPRVQSLQNEALVTLAGHQGKAENEDLEWSMEEGEYSNSQGSKISYTDGG